MNFIRLGKVVIIGYGIVGKATGEVLGLKHFIDIDGPQDDELLSEYECFILCLPTPTVDGKQDLYAIHEWLQTIKGLATDPIVIIRSTILPGTTAKLSEEYGLKIVHVPEFLTEATAIDDAKTPELLVIGADDIILGEQVRDLFISHISHKWLIMTSTKTAELIKYTMNSWFALKVVFANQLWDVCEKIDADYQQVQSALERHKWGSQNGWNVWQGGFRGYGGKCLPKDVEAFIYAFDLPLLAQMQEINQKLVKETS